MTTNEEIMQTRAYRGKDKVSGEWVYGDLVNIKNGNGYTPHIYTHDIALVPLREVVPDTVGRCTGICDMDGAIAYEHDIIANDLGDEVGAIEWDSRSAALYIRIDGIAESCEILNLYRVIGNLHDDLDMINSHYALREIFNDTDAAEGNNGNV